MWFKPTKRHIFIASATIGIAAIFGCAQERLDKTSRVEKRVPAVVAEPEEVKVEVVLKDEPAAPHAASVAPSDAATQPVYSAGSQAVGAASAPDMLSSAGYSGAPISGPGYAGIGALGGGADVPYGAGAWGGGIGVDGIGGGIGGIGGIGGFDGGFDGGIGGWDGGIGPWDGGIGPWADGIGPWGGPVDVLAGPVFGPGFPFLATDLIIIDDDHRRHHRDDDDRRRDDDENNDDENNDDEEPAP